MSEAHAVLSDTAQRRQYDAMRPAQSMHAQPTGAGGRMHPYAAQAAAEAAARGFRRNDDRPPDFTTRRLFGLDEDVWLAHHYGVQGRASQRWTTDVPGRRYGMHLVDEQLEHEHERIRRCVDITLRERKSDCAS